MFFGYRNFCRWRRAARGRVRDAAALTALRACGIRIVMLTGDNRTTANAVAKRLGIQDVEAEILPDRKSAVVAKLKREGRAVAMADDASTTRRRWRRPISASRWDRARMLRWRAPV